ncbi:MAG: thiol-disulfide oxidoreductase DCC family protein [Roseobacter sp.]
MKQTSKRAIWVFDSNCALCDGGVHYTLRHEKTDSIRFVSIQSETGRALAQKHGIDPDDPLSFLFIEQGIALEKSDAIMALADHLDGPARAARLLRFMPKWLRDAGYVVLARNRYRVFGKTDRCIIPTPQNADRFTL